MQIQVKSLEDLQEAAAKILSFADENKTFVFYGEMGAGKTTLINTLCEILGIVDQPSSPTFSIVNEYESGKGTIFHFDFYRIKNQYEAFDLGYEEYFYSGNYCFIEWPERIPDILPEKYIEVKIEVLSEVAREISVRKKS